LSVRSRGIVSVQNPIRLNATNEPLSDVTVLRPKKNRYRDALPTGKDVLIAIEVADTTAVHDRTVKIPSYAKYGVREAWLVDLKAGVIEVYTLPRQGRYTIRTAYGRGETLVSQAIEGLSFAVGDIIS